MKKVLLALAITALLAPLGTGMLLAQAYRPPRLKHRLPQPRRRRLRRRRRLSHHGCRHQKRGAPKPEGPRAIRTARLTGTVSDISVADAKKGLTIADVVNQVGQNKIAINFVWTLVTGFLVMFMQAGFAIVETGLCRAKNANHTMMMNFMVYGVGMLAYWLIGFAIQMGGVGAVANLGGHGRRSTRSSPSPCSARLSASSGRAASSSRTARPMTSA